MSENENRNVSTIRTVPSKAAREIRLLVLDLDGTIVDRSNCISDAVTQALESVKRRGIAVAIATGRRFQSSLPAYDLVGSTLPLICYEGGLVRDRNAGISRRHWPMEPRAIAKLL